MDREKIDSAIRLLQSMDYHDKLEVYSKIYDIGTFSEDMNDKLVLISLLTLTYRKMKEKNPDITPLMILMKLTNTSKSNNHYYLMLESLSIIVENFSYACKKVDNCGLTNSQDIINKIKQILDLWLPF